MHVASSCHYSVLSLVPVHMHIASPYAVKVLPVLSLATACFSGEAYMFKIPAFSSALKIVYRKCNLPMNPHVRLLVGLSSVGGLSVGQRSCFIL